MIDEKARRIRRLDRLCNETTGWPAFAFAIERAADDGVIRLKLIDGEKVSVCQTGGAD